MGSTDGIQRSTNRGHHPASASFENSNFNRRPSSDNQAFTLIYNGSWIRLSWHVLKQDVSQFFLNSFKAIPFSRCILKQLSFLVLSIDLFFSHQGTGKDKFQGICRFRRLCLSKLSKTEFYSRVFMKQSKTKSQFSAFSMDNRLRVSSCIYPSCWTFFQFQLKLVSE